MDFYTTAIFASSILIPASLALARFKKMDSQFLPFVILLWIGVASEAAGILLSIYRHSNAISFNLYQLASAIFLNWQFRQWKLISFRRHLYILQAFIITWWIAEWMLTGTLHAFFSWFIIADSVIVLFFATRGMTQFFHLPVKQLLRHSTIIICAGLVAFYMYALIVEVFYLYGLNGSRFFKMYVQSIMPYVNLIINLLFAYAILWTPPKRSYIMGY